MSKLDHWKHMHQTSHKTWLSFSDPEEVTERLNLHSWYPGKRVLDVGIGGGTMAKWLLKQECTPICVDIVPEAFDCLPDGAQRFLLHELKETQPLGCDVAICWLVAQHCSDEKLIDLLTTVRPHTNLLAIQYASTPESRKEEQHELHVERSPEQIVRLAGLSGYGYRAVGEQLFPVGRYPIEYLYRYAHLS